MRKIREVLRLKYELGFTHRTIAKALRVAVGTVSEYLAKAKKGGLSWPLPEELSDGELEAGLFPPAKPPVVFVKTSTCLLVQGVSCGSGGDIWILNVDARIPSLARSQTQSLSC